METVYFGAGCFWGVEFEFSELDGVLDTEVGYMGGEEEKERYSYEEVCSGKTGHAEVVKVVFDPEKISFEDLLRKFWEIHDPTQLNRQGPDIGAQYRSAIFFTTEEQKKIAEKSKRGIKGAVTEIRPAGKFYRAEEYHQDYNRKRGLSSCRI